MLHQVNAGEAVRFEMNGVEYRLRFTLRALKTLEHEHQISVMRGGEGVIEAVRDPEKLALVLYYGMRANHPEITLEWVEDTFDASMLLGLAPVIAQAITGRAAAATLPNVAEPGKVNGVGSPSGPSDDTISPSAMTSSGTSALKN